MSTRYLLVTQFVGLWLATFMLSMAAIAGDQEPVEASCERTECGLTLHSANGNVQDAPTLDTVVEINVSGVAVHTMVKQQFANPTDEWVEGIYSFPLPVGAAVNELKMRIGERVIVGEIHEKAEAEKRYQKAKASGRKASLVKSHRPNLFTTKVANLGPREKISIEIAYFQELPISASVQSLRFPMVVGPRYSPPVGTTEFAPQNHISTSTLRDSPKIPTVVGDPNHNSISIDVNISIGAPLAVLDSLYHEIDTTRDDLNYRIRLTEGVTTANRDFVLEFAPELPEAPKMAVLTEQRDGYKYGLVMLMPPLAEQAIALPREVTYILDRSGSMSGTSIDQAKAALGYALGELHAHDRFNLIYFNSDHHALFDEPVAASPENIRLARSQTNKIAATGGTEMLGALMRALEAPTSSQHLRQVIFITDGNVSNEDQLFNYIEKSLSNRHLFTIGIGSAPNHHFLKGAAQAGRGFHTAIGDLREVESRMTVLLRRLNTPVLGDIQMDFLAPGEVGTSFKNTEVEYWPRTLPDLYAGETVAFAFRTKQKQLSVAVSGKLPDKHWHTTLELVGGQQRRGLAELWAHRKIGALMINYRRNEPYSEERSQVRADIVETAIENHLVSKFTSLVAVDKTPSNPELVSNKVKHVPRSLPHGWRANPQISSLPRTGTDAKLRLFGGLCLVLIAVAIASRQDSAR
ncbi:MAG: marine proteobacterial sortase target protein [Pseudomonadota bacterium]